MNDLVLYLNINGEFLVTKAASSLLEVKNIYEETIFIAIISAFLICVNAGTDTGRILR